MTEPEPPPEPETTERPTDLLTARQIAEMRGVAPKTIVNYHKTSRDAGYPPDKFPRPTKIIEGLYPRWRRSVITKYFAQVDARGGPGDFRKGEDRTPRVRKDAKVTIPAES